MSEDTDISVARHEEPPADAAPVPTPVDGGAADAGDRAADGPSGADTENAGAVTGGPPSPSPSLSLSDSAEPDGDEPDGDEPDGDEPGGDELDSGGPGGDEPAPAGRLVAVAIETPEPREPSEPADAVDAVAAVAVEPVPSWQDTSADIDGEGDSVPEHTPAAEPNTTETGPADANAVQVHAAETAEMAETVETAETAEMAETDAGEADTAVTGTPEAEPGGEAEPDSDQPVSEAELRAAAEAVLLVVDSPIAVADLARVLDVPAARATELLCGLRDEYDEQSRGFTLREVADGWRMYTREDYARYVERYVLDGQQARLTQAALETLAVVAYRQPVTRSRIAAIRGVGVDGVMRTLLTRGLVEECGSDPETSGNLYRTTPLFLEKLGLNSLSELPSLAPLLPEIDAVDDVATSA